MGLDELSGIKVAIVHDALVDKGGAERVVLVFREMFPKAPVFTSVFWPSTTLSEFRSADVRTSVLQKLLLSRSLYKLFLPLYPLVFEQFDFSEYDLVLSSSAYFAKGIITKPETCHVCYCNTPSRLAWRYHEYTAGAGFSPFTRLVLPFVVHWMRTWDYTSAQRVDYFVAGSRNSARRIQKFYGRQAAVIHSPIEVSGHRVSEEVEDYFLVVSRLIAYKRIDLIVDAFNQLGFPLIIVGDGPMRSSLSRQARSNIRFLGRVDDRELKQLYSRCRALVIAAEEDYGLTPLEAQASGRPVIAYAAGGVLETVIDGTTAVFFKKQTVEAVCDAIRRLDDLSFDPLLARAHALKYDVSCFRELMGQFLVRSLEHHRTRTRAIGSEQSVQ